ncbi:hypothetical protein UlMin_029908 [Ulmus minor]
MSPPRLTLDLVNLPQVPGFSQEAELLADQVTKIHNEVTQNLEKANANYKSFADTKRRDKELEGKVAIITGGARGIGAATANLFAQNGAHVIIADILDDLGANLADSISGRYLHCDVSKESDVEAVTELALKWKGKLNIMFNNAGISGPVGGSITSLDMEKFKQLISVNVHGIVHGINSAAIMGGLGSHFYTLSKGAINGLVRSAACELGVHGIRVNSLSPHGVPTDMLVGAFKQFLGKVDMKPEEVGRLVAIAEDVAQAALFLASEESGFVTSHNLLVDGGYTSANSAMSFIYQ